jgi:FAD/FMN-containing dehydrogenase
MSVTLERELVALVGRDRVLTHAAVRPYLRDATEARGLVGEASAVVLPRTTEEVRAVVAWAYQRDVPLTPQGGRTGYAGGAVPLGGVVVALDLLAGAPVVEPELWRMHAGAGATTRTIQRVARENGLYYPPDPGAAEQSQLGGNIATNAGGPHAFKYGVTGAWVSGIEVVLPPGDVVEVGGPIRKDVGGYDLKSLLVGSEGTLGIVTAAWLRLIPAVEAALPIVAFFPDVESGAAAVEAAMTSGITPSAIEFVDGEAAALLLASYPFEQPGADVGFVVIAEADGTHDQARLGTEALVEMLGERAVALHRPEDRREVAELWRWREGLGYAVEGALGGKVSEDIVVPLDRLAEAVSETLAIGRRHELRACSWGHAGDGNLHSTFLLSPRDGDAVRRAEEAAVELFALAGRLGGGISGEHGLGQVKSGQLRHQWGQTARHLHAGVKQLFDPKNLLNPGKKVA